MFSNAYTEIEHLFSRATAATESGNTRKSNTQYIATVEIADSCANRLSVRSDAKTKLCRFPKRDCRISKALHRHGVPNEIKYARTHVIEAGRKLVKS